MNRTEIEIALNRTRADLLGALSDIAAETLTMPATPSEHDPSLTWSLADHICHMAVVERWRNEIIRTHFAGRATDNPFVNAEGNILPRDEIRAAVNKRNEAWAEEHRTTDRDALVKMGLEVRAGTLALLAGLTADQVNIVIPGLPFPDSSVGGIVAGNVGHSEAHLGMARAALASRDIQLS